MHRVMLVDDEYMILKGMAKIVDWHQYGFEIVQTARNGKQAVAAFKNQPVDLVITDVRMPEMTGLALMQQLQALPQPPLFIALSGYQEFDYVKQALQFGAIDYLVKPIDTQELERVLKKAQARLELRTQTAVTRQYYLEMQTERLVSQELDEVAINQLLQRAGVSADAHKFTMVCCNVVTNYDALSQACQQFHQNLYYVSQHQFIICFVGSHQALAQLTQFLEAHQLIAGDAFITAGQRVSHLSALTDSLEQAQTLAELYQFYEKRSGALSDADRTAWLRQAEVPKVSLTKFKRALQSNNQALMVTLTQALFVKLSNERVTPTYARQIAFLVLNILSETQVFSNQEYEAQLMAIDHAPTIASLEQTVLAMVKRCKPQTHRSFSKNVQQVIEIVQQEYAQDLSLTQVAGRLHLNPVYLGQLFKKEVQTSFSKYLNQYRIDQAKQLLANTDESISNIALDIGYTNSGYFYKNFRLICNLSPKEYRRQILGQPMA